MANYDTGRDILIMAECHSDRKRHAKGLCRQCYDAQPVKRIARRDYQRREWASLEGYKRLRERRWAEYGITNPDGSPFLYSNYEVLLVKQDKVCAICKRLPNQKALAVDHNHETGVVLGLLCTRCNGRLLVAAWHSREILQRAADYLNG